MNPWPKWEPKLFGGVKPQVEVLGQPGPRDAGRLSTTPVFLVNVTRADQFTSFVRTGKPVTATSTPRFRISPPLNTRVAYPVLGASAACKIRSVMFFW